MRRSIPTILGVLFASFAFNTASVNAEEYYYRVDGCSQRSVTVSTSETINFSVYVKADAGENLDVEIYNSQGKLVTDDLKTSYANCNWTASYGHFRIVVRNPNLEPIDYKLSIYRLGTD